MKINSGDLAGGIAKAGGHPTPITYDKNKATLHGTDPSGVYDAEVFEFIKSQGVEIAMHLKSALELRASGRFVLSPREADITARGKFNLKSEFLMQALLHKGFLPFFTEGTPGMEITGWNLRTSYNLGIKWLNTKREQELAAGNHDRVKSGDEKLVNLRLQLAQMDLPLWPKEVENGVPIDLTKPEWQTWQQYTDACQRSYLKFSLHWKGFCL